jgi:O-6-methylguanine DNA methyltransferase
MTTRTNPTKTTTLYWTLFDSPIGTLLAAVSPGGVCALEFDGTKSARTIEARLARRHPMAVIERVEPTHQALAPVRTWLARYFDGARPEGRELDLDLHGTAFEVAVWKKLLAVPAGRTWTYGALADKVGHPGSARAVGGAVGSNPVAVIVPCHRIVGANGTLTGFGGGLPRKRWLLEHEAVLPASLGLTP